MARHPIVTAPDSELDRLVIRQVTDVDWECRCGAGAGGWVGSDHPDPWDLLCSDCMIDLFDALNPHLAEEDSAFDVFVRDIERRLGRVWLIPAGQLL
jgi:hypothetical protein